MQNKNGSQTNQEKPVSEMELMIGIKNLDELHKLVKNLNEAIEALEIFKVEVTISKPL